MHTYCYNDICKFSLASLSTSLASLSSTLASLSTSLASISSSLASISSSLASLSTSLASISSSLASLRLPWQVFVPLSSSSDCHIQLYSSYNPTVPGDQAETVGRLTNCIREVRRWMTQTALGKSDSGLVRLH